MNTPSSSSSRKNDSGVSYGTWTTLNRRRSSLTMLALTPQSISATFLLPSFSYLTISGVDTSATRFRSDGYSMPRTLASTSSVSSSKAMAPRRTPFSRMPMTRDLVSSSVMPGTFSSRRYSSRGFPPYMGDTFRQSSLTA